MVEGYVVLLGIVGQNKQKNNQKLLKHNVLKPRHMYVAQPLATNMQSAFSFP